MQRELENNINRSLILAGGGVRLAYHAGVLIALEEAGVVFNHVDGTSGGIFGTAMLASGISPKETAVRWRALNLKGFMAAMPLQDYSSQHKLPGLGSADGIRKKIFPALGISPEKINSNSRFRATFNVCNFSKKTIECIDGKDVTEDHLIAGMSLPVFMPAVNINSDWYTDAVWIKDANITEAIKSGAEDIWLVWCIGNNSQFLNGSFNQYVHMIEISANGGLFAEIKLLRSANKDKKAKGLNPINLHIIKPAYALPLDPDFLFNKINADTLINMGYADAKQYLTKRDTFAASEEISNSTAMITVDASLHFRQQFKGQIIIDSVLTPVVINISFFVREADGRFIFQLFSSIAVDKADPVSGYDNQVIVNGDGKIASRFKFIFNSVDYTANLKMELQSVIDLLIGIDNKTAQVNITHPGGANNTDTIFFQPAINRIKNAFYLNVNADVGWFEKLKLKNRLLSQLLKRS